MTVQAERERIRKLTGSGCYTADERFAGAARAVFLRSPHPHARIVGLDTRAAAAMPGVVRILTGDDCIAAGFGNFPIINPFGEKLAISHRPVLAHEVARHPGEAVACIVAETAAQALDAAEAIDLAWEALPAATGIAAALAPGAPIVHAAAPGNVVLRHEVGDAACVDAGMAQAALVVTAELELPRLAPVTMEPRAAAARYDSAQDIYELRAPNQGVNELRRDCSAVFGIPGERFHILPGDVGGGFGPRAIAYPEYAALLLAARLTGRPVAWHGTRSESFLTDVQGRGVRMRGRLALDASGRFTAFAMEYDADLGAYLSPVGALANVLNPTESLTGCYAIPALHAAFRLLHTHAVPTGPYRGAGRPEVALMVERLVDLAARRRGEDPFAIRNRNVIPPDHFPYALPNGPRYDSADFPALLQAARKAADWDGFPARRAASARSGRRLGRGLALFIETSGGGRLPDEAAVTLAADAGRATLRIETVTASSGQSHARTFALIAAPRLGLGEDAVTLIASDKLTRLSGSGSYASRSTIAAGNAVAQATDAIAARVLALGALRGNCAAEELHLTAGEVRRADGSTVCKLVALLDTPIAAVGKVAPSQAFASGCHVAELEVDPATGLAALTRYVAVDDAGVTIDEQAAEAQIHGGIAQGVGEALDEDFVIASDSGQPVAASFMDYALPRAARLPFCRTVACNTPSPANPLGVKGIGEAGTTGALCAVVSAVDDLVGDALPPLPFTPERLFLALRGPV